MKIDKLKFTTTIDGEAEAMKAYKVAHPDPPSMVSMLKELYDDKIIGQLMFKDNPFLKMIKKLLEIFKWI